MLDFYADWCVVQEMEKYTFPTAEAHGQHCVAGRRHRQR
jgi:thiol:disulfide interchange protein